MGAGQLLRVWPLQFTPENRERQLTQRQLKFRMFQEAEYRAELLNTTIDVYPNSIALLKEFASILPSIAETILGSKFNSVGHVEYVYECCFDKKNERWCGSLIDSFCKWLSSIGFESQTNCHHWMFNSLVMMSVKIDRGMILEPKFVMEDSITWDLNNSLKLKLKQPIEYLQLEAPFLPEIGNMSDDNYRDICSQIVEEHIKKSRKEKEASKDYVSIKKHRKLHLHLRWLLWKLKEGWSYEKISSEEAELYGEGKSPSAATIHEAIAGTDGVGQIFGIRF